MNVRSFVAALALAQRLHPFAASVAVEDERVVNRLGNFVDDIRNFGVPRSGIAGLIAVGRKCRRQVQKMAKDRQPGGETQNSRLRDPAHRRANET